MIQRKNPEDHLVEYCDIWPCLHCMLVCSPENQSTTEFLAADLHSEDSMTERADYNNNSLA